MMGKLRGRRRHLRRAVRWQQVVEPLDFRDREYDYRKIGLRPWSDGGRAKQPPAGIRRELVRGLLRTYAQWQRELEAQAEPFYLAVWLFERPLGESQVVAATGARIAHYEQVFRETTPRPLPPEYGQLAGVGQLTWWTGVEIVADYEPPAHPVRGYRQESMADGTVVYCWDGGRVWVGRAWVSD